MYVSVHHNHDVLIPTGKTQVTNAAGGLNPDYAVGDIVLLNDVNPFPNLVCLLSNRRTAYLSRWIGRNTSTARAQYRRVRTSIPSIVRCI